MSSKTRPRLDLREIQSCRREADATEQSVINILKSELLESTSSTSVSNVNSDVDDSDAFDTDGADLDAEESVASASSKGTSESIHVSVQDDEHRKLLEHQSCSSSSTSQRRDRVRAGLVASNDFFTPRPICLPRSPSALQVHHSFLTCDREADCVVASCKEMALNLKKSGEVDPHPDSLRSRYASKSCLKQSPIEVLKPSHLGTPRLGTPRLSTPRDGCSTNCSAGFKERVTSFTRRIQADRRCGSRSGSSARDLETQLLEHGMTPIYQPESWIGIPPPKLLLSADVSDVRSFLAHPAPRGCGPIPCHIRRKSGADSIHPRYKLYLTEGTHFLLSARKRKKSMSSNYIMSLDEDDISRRTGNYFGKLRSNFLGTEFWFYDKGARPTFGGPAISLSKRVEMGAVTYQNNVLGIRGPRKMTAIIPAVDADGKPYVFEPGPNGSHTILTKYKSGQDQQKMVVMYNKKPVWNKEVGAYCLNFEGRVTRPSVKNFQLAADDDKEQVILQFGKVRKDGYNMDYQYPMSALQAFAICLSSLDYKFACE